MKTFYKERAKERKQGEKKIIRSEMKEVKRGKVYLSNKERVLVGEKRVLEVGRRHSQRRKGLRKNSERHLGV